MNRVNSMKLLLDERFRGNQAKFARAIDRSPNLVWQYLNEHRTMGEKFARHIEFSLGLEPGWLDGNPGSENEPSSLESANAWDDSCHADMDRVVVPLLREVKLASGNGHQIDYNCGKTWIHKSTLLKSGVPEEAAACAYVSGDSMETKLPNGSTIGIDTREASIVDGKVYAIDHNGEFRVKQVFRIPGGQGYRFHSFNSDPNFPDEEYSPEMIEKQNIRIIGRVFWSAMHW